MKRCKHCGVEKPLDEFYRDTAARDGRRPECKACTSAQRKAWYRRNKEREVARVVAWQRDNRERYNASQRAYKRENRDKERANYLVRKFGITQDDYARLLAQQGGRCAICRRKPGKVSLHVDHDHDTGEVRGLLCFRCNGGLGQFGERADRLAVAAAYLERDDELDELARDRARALTS